MFILMFVAPVLSLNLTLNAQESFKVNETISVNFTLESDEPKQVTYVSSFQCDTVPVGFPERNTVQLTGDGVTATEELTEVTDEFESGQCNFTISTSSPQRITKSKVMDIDTDPKIDLQVDICQTKKCENTSKTFDTDDEVYIDYNTNAESPELSAKISRPGEDISNITLPSKVNLEREGTYRVNIKASKAGYRSAEQESSFAAVKEYNISEDTRENQSVDAKSQETDSRNQTLYILGGAILLATLAIIKLVL
jgi:hypothetical protein